MVDEKKDLDDTDAGKLVRAEIIKERLIAEKTIAELQEQHKELLQAQDIKSAEALAEVREEFTIKIAALDTAFERIKISTERLIQEKYDKMLLDQALRHDEQMRNLRAERESQEMELERKKKTQRTSTDTLRAPQSLKLLARTPVFTNKTLYVSPCILHPANGAHG
jgi:hypothetical protein